MTCLLCDLRSALCLLMLEWGEVAQADRFAVQTKGELRTLLGKQ